MTADPARPITIIILRSPPISERLPIVTIIIVATMKYIPIMNPISAIPIPNDLANNGTKVTVARNPMFAQKTPKLRPIKTILNR